MPVSASRSLVSSMQLSSQRELVLLSAHGTPDCTSSCCWLTPRFDVGSTSCSTTPCSSTRCAVDDVVNAASPCSSVTSSSSSSSATHSCDQLQLSAQANVTSTDIPPLCSKSHETLEPCETSAHETACLSDDLAPSMHSSAECARPLVTYDVEPSHTRSTSQELSDQ